MRQLKEQQYVSLSFKVTKERRAWGRKNKYLKLLRKFVTIITILPWGMAGRVTRGAGVILDEENQETKGESSPDQQSTRYRSKRDFG